VRFSPAFLISGSTFLALFLGVLAWSTPSARCCHPGNLPLINHFTNDLTECRPWATLVDMNDNEPKPPLAPPTAAEKRHYFRLKQLVIDDLDVIDTAFYRLAGNLRAILEEYLYRVEFPSFDKFCETVCGKHRSYIYRLIKSREIIDRLKEAGVPKNELPDHERVCRELAAYPANDQHRIYQRARELRISQNRTEPLDSETIREAAMSIDSTRAERAKITAALEFIQSVEGMRRKLEKTNIDWTMMDVRHQQRLWKALSYLMAVCGKQIQGRPKELEYPEEREEDQS
jgi:hypothetical protein